MDTAGYVILSRLASQQRGVEVLAQNLANADTPGFKASRMMFGEYVSRQSGISTVPGDRQISFAQDRATWRDTQAGPVTPTGNPLDAAITGEGFFVVQTPRGDRYTRAGRFTVGADGRVTDLGGNAVLDPRGNPLMVAQTDTRLEITGDGTLRSENGPIGKLRVVRFDDQQSPTAEGDRLFNSSEPPVDVARPTLAGGAIEGSNVRPVLELTRLTDETRQFQFAAQFLQRDADRVSTAVDRLLHPRT